jgi:hypothetical protein
MQVFEDSTNANVKFVMHLRVEIAAFPFKLEKKYIFISSFLSVLP